MKSFSVLRIWAEHGMRSSAEATPVRRSRMDLEFLRGNRARTESDLPSQSIPCPRICVRRRPALTPGKGERKGWMNWIKEQLNAGRAAHVIADLKPSWSARLFGGRLAQVALRPPQETRIAGRLRRRGKRLHAHRRDPIQTGGVPLVESGRQRLARRRMLPRKHAAARLPILEGLLRRSRLTKNHGTRFAEHRRITNHLLQRYARLCFAIGADKKRAWKLQASSARKEQRA